MGGRTKGSTDELRVIRQVGFSKIFDRLAKNAVLRFVGRWECVCGRAMKRTSGVRGRATSAEQCLGSDEFAQAY